jgi:multiple sugar transport system ATP-binding protein
MAFLEIKSLNKRFGQLDVLKDIDLAVEQGGFLVLVGPSGCGKSTLLNIIAGLEPLTTGEIWIGGRNVNDLHPSQRDIAMVFQSYALYPNMNVAKNISFGLEMRRVPKAERDKAVAEAARTLQIEHLLQRRPGQLSGGQRQRVAMGRALVRKPQVFLFDEPLSNLDAKLRVDMRTEIKLLHQRLRTTVVYVTHDQIEAMTLATMIAVLKDGVVQQVGSPSQIYNSPANMFVADFMGSPAMNLMPAAVRNGDGRLVVAVKDEKGGELTLALPPALAALSGHVGREVVFGLRPEAISSPFAGQRGNGRFETADCLVEVVEPAGADTFVIIRLAGTEVMARLPADARLEAGSAAPFAFDMSRAVFFDPATSLRIA